LKGGELKLWFTENDPHVRENAHGVWVKTDINKAKTLFSGNMKVGDLVFIYETRYDRDHSISNGRSKVVALVRVRRLPFDDGEWVRIAETSWVTALDCPEDEAHTIVGKYSFRKFGLWGLNVMEINQTMALRFMDYCKSTSDYITLMSKYFSEEMDDFREQKQIEKAEPDDYQKTPRRVEFTKTKGGQKVKTNPGIAKRRIVLANYKCEINHSHKTFKSSVTGRNYVEAHHLVPLSAQEKFGENSLDHEANIFSLCPNCHRLVHHAILEEKRALLKKLYVLREKELAEAGISLALSELMEYY